MCGGFVCCQEAANMRPVDNVGRASPGAAACLRFKMIREQTIPCTTRTNTKTNLLCGVYKEEGVISRDRNVVRVFFTAVNRTVRITDSDETE